MDPYIPDKLPIDLSALDWQKVSLKISEASAALAYYNGVLESIVNPAIFLSPLETKEAVLSSRIEGTITTVDEVLRYEVDLKPESQSKQNDIVEVLNYRKATRFAKDWLSRDLPLNPTLMCAIQKELIQGVRGENKHPGEIRKDQVWIGPRGCSMEEAACVPPEPLSLQTYLNNLIDYMNRSDQETLIQTAIIHAQFEIIHPFDDGNGRTGCILIPLYLWCKKRISSPMFYISEYFDEKRELYIDNLRRISAKKDWQPWILFFLEAVSIQSKRNSEKARNVLDLYNYIRNRISGFTKSPHAMKILDTLFLMPIFRTSDFIRNSGLVPHSAYRIMAILKEKKILTTIQEHSGRSPEILMFEELFDLIR
jgi:Fic family protein